MIYLILLNGGGIIIFVLFNGMLVWLDGLICEEDEVDLKQLLLN